MSVIVSKQTSDQLSRVMAFFGIDEYNRPLFRKAAESCGVEPFSIVIGALDAVVQMDSRYGATARIHSALAAEKAERRRK